MPTINGPNAGASDDVWERLDRLAERYERRTLAFPTSRRGPLVVDYHVQGVARIDHPNGLTTLVCSCSGQDSGTLWFSAFQREPYQGPQGQRRVRLKQPGAIQSTIVTTSPHPGGMQALGSL